MSYYHHEYEIYNSEVAWPNKLQQKWYIGDIIYAIFIIYTGAYPTYICIYMLFFCLQLDSQLPDGQ